MAYLSKDLGKLIDSLIFYDSETGALTWRNHPQAGGEWRSPATWEDNEGYLVVTLYGRNYSSAWIAWVISTGNWPEIGLMFRDGDCKNNRLSNIAEIAAN